MSNLRHWGSWSSSSVSLFCGQPGTTLNDGVFRITLMILNNYSSKSNSKEAKADANY